MYFLYGTVDFLNEEIHYVPIGDGDMWYYVPVDDGWEEVLGRNVYITSLYFSPNAKYWTATSGNRTRAPPDRMWTLYHWAMESVHNMGVLMSQYFSPNAKYWTGSSGNRTRAPLDRMLTLYHELWNLYIIWVCLRPSTSLQMPNTELRRPGIELGPPLIECGRSTIELWNLYIIWVC
jgi:hypothetical protein